MTSIGIIGAARSGLIVGRHPDHPDLRVLASTKSNLGPPPQSLIYSVERAGDVGRIAWGGECELTADQLLAADCGKGSPGGAAVREAEEFLRSVLACGAKPANEIGEHAKAEGIAARTLQRAKKLLGIRSSKDGMTGAWHWEPPAPPDEDGQHAGSWPPSAEKQGKRDSAGWP
jgi:hypothetical protein